MKLTGIMLIVISLQVSGAAFTQSVSINYTRVSVKRVLREIIRQTGISIVYRETQLEKLDKVSIHVKDVSIQEALNLCLKDQPITYKLVDNTLVIDPEPVVDEPKKVVGTPVSPHIRVTGQVTDQDGSPLQGASIKVKGSAIGTATDVNGLFAITLPDSASVLEVSFVGYESIEQKVARAGSISVSLKHVGKKESDVVVVGYGTMKKKDLSAAVSVVPDIDQIKERPVLDVASMIQGKVPGVTVVNNGGHPTQPPTVTIRGVGSRGQENVLYVVDGVPNGSYNPADVVSVTILKDAASAAIYGAFSGSAGVILITTRQASAGRPTVEYSGFTGVNQAWRIPESLTAGKQTEIVNLSYANAGLPLLAGWNPAKNPDVVVTRTDWMHEIFRTPLIQRHTVTINSGNDKFSTLIQGRYEDNEGTLINTFNTNSSLRFNTFYQLNPKVRFSQDLFYNVNSQNDAQTAPGGYQGVILDAIFMPRSATVYNPDGTFGGVGKPGNPYLGIFGQPSNPVALQLRNSSYNRRNNLQSVSELRVSNVINGLAFTSRFSFLNSNGFVKNFDPKVNEPGGPLNSQNYLYYYEDKSYNWVWENTLNYLHNFGRHSLSAMASTTAQESGDKGFSAGARGFSSEAGWARYFVNASDFVDDRPSDYDWTDRNLSYVGRLSYSWANRYFLTGSYRYDIAGRLAAAYRGKSFPGVTGAWKITSEPWFKVPELSLLKLRASWGRIGNLGSVPMYYGYPSLTADLISQVGNGAPSTTVLYPSNATNLSLSWETSQQTDVGMDLDILKGAFSVIVDYFKKRTFDLIQQQTAGWPTTFGLGAPLLNQGKIDNSGIEVAATWRGDAGKLHFEIGGNIATLKNRVAYIDGSPGSFWSFPDSWRQIIAPFRSIVGQPYYSYWLLKTAGLFQSDAGAAAYVDKNGNRIQPNAKAGDVKFVDVNGDGKIDDNDRVYMGAASPKITFGFTAKLAWKHFDLSLFLQGVNGSKLYNVSEEITLNEAEVGFNRWNKILDAWSPTNPHGTIPRISATDPNLNFQSSSDLYLQNGNYIRLKSLVIGYTFPKIAGISGLRVYFSGDNLITLTKYTGLDPEVGGNGLDGMQFPLARVYAVGAKLTF